MWLKKEEMYYIIQNRLGMVQLKFSSGKSKRASHSGHTGLSESFVTTERAIMACTKVSLRVREYGILFLNVEWLLSKE